MSRLPTQNQLPPAVEAISFQSRFSGKYRGFAAFLIACALLVAAFAISAVWMRGGDGAGWLQDKLPFGDREQTSVTDPPAGSPDQTNGTPPQDVPPLVPSGAAPIESVDLSCQSFGLFYIHNETVYAPDTAALLQAALPRLAESDAPTVLILHTHTSESYLPSGSAYVEGAIGDATYSTDPNAGVVSVGEVLCRTLEKYGIRTIHCTAMHDQPTLGGAYGRSLDTVKTYLQAYPSIRLVIDLHRDSILRSDGAFVRTLASSEEEPTAQIMAVVGSDANGTAFSGEGWKANLALALQLRELLNRDGRTVARPVTLKNASYNQELAPYSLLLEIGSAANSLEEAKRAAAMVGESLAELLR